MVKKAYSVKTKLACIEMKKASKSNKVIMDSLGIKNASQVKTWQRWYQKLPQGALLHSDKESVYTSKAYYQACTEKGITRSMSRKGTPADNACIEWFHSVLKSETFYLHKWRNLTKDSITDIVKNYIIFSNETRIQQKLNDQSPVDYRKLIA